jgi:hypothetical protein
MGATLRAGCTWVNLRAIIGLKIGTGKIASQAYPALTRAGGEGSVQIATYPAEV